MTNKLIAFFRNPGSVSIAAILIIFLALVRCISEFFRLQAIRENELTIAEIKPFIIGALICAVSLLGMFILYLFKRYRIVVVLMVLTIAVMLFVKFRFNLS
jgi:hypothetical protein